VDRILRAVGCGACGASTRGTLFHSRAGWFLALSDAASSSGGCDWPNDGRLSAGCTWTACRCSARCTKRRLTCIGTFLLRNEMELQIDALLLFLGDPAPYVDQVASLSSVSRATRSQALAPGQWPVLIHYIQSLISHSFFLNHTPSIPSLLQESAGSISLSFYNLGLVP
jgi:hypothetical protein